MGAPRSSAAAPEWLPSGFPPRSFQAGAPAPPPPGAPGGGGRGGRGWWFAAAAAFLAVLLLAAALLAATSGDDGPDVAAGTSTTGLDTSLPTFEATTTALPILPSIDPVTTPPSDPTPSTTAAGAAPAAPGVLEPSLTTLTMPRADASAGASQAALTLRNRGGTALTYSTQSNVPGLSATPAQGTIEPGASTAVTVTLDAAQIKTEGPFGGTLSFAGTGGTPAVQVMSVVGRPPEIGEGVGESCRAPSASCSRQIKVAPSTSPTPTPCNTAWLYSVTITDQSRIQSARAIARRNGVNADLPLQRFETGDLFLSDPRPPLPAGTTLRFVIEAVDEHGFRRSLAEQTIVC